MRLARSTLQPYALPLVRTLRTSRGRFAHRRGWLLALHDDRGAVGWGDAAPWPGFGSDDGRVASELTTLVDDRALEGIAFDQPDDVWRFVSEQRLAPEVSHAVELALLDLIGREQGLPLADLLGRGAQDPRTHALVVEPPEASPPDALASVLKLKVGGSLDDDERHVAALRATCRPEVELRLDAGGGWNEAAAHAALDRLARYRIAWVEQPLARHADWSAMARVRAHAEQLGITMALDESIRDAESLRAAIDAKATDAVVLKPMFLGGLGPSLALARAARQAGVEAIVTNALESAIGRTAAIHLAALLDGVHGLSDVLARDVAEAPARRGDQIRRPRGDGLGIAPRGSERSTSVGARTIAIPHPLESARLARADRVALVTDAETLSYGELCARVQAAASQLAARGIRAGMRVALSGEANVDWVVGFHALSWLGAAVAPLPTRSVALRAQFVDAIAADAQLNATDIRDLRGPSVGTVVPERFWPLDEIRAVVCTSGSTAAPRAVELTTAQLCFSAFGSAIRLGHDTDDRWLCCLPLHHVGGLSIVVRCAFYATTVVLHPRFDATRVARAIDDGEVSLVSLVPEMLAAVLDARADTPFPPSLRAVLVGGGPMPEPLLERCRRLALPIALTWGMTEAASQVCTRRPGDLDARRDSGAPLLFARVGQRGERLVVRGPIVDDELVSSDLGRVDERGRVQVEARADDAIISGGEKIAPERLERVLCAHPSIREAVVMGRPDARWGQRPVALLVAQGPRAASEALREHCRRSLPAFEVPDAFHYTDTLPKSDLGKVLRSEVKRLLDESLGLEQAEPAHAVEQRRGRRAGDEAVERHESVLGLHARTHLTVLAAQGVLKADRSLAESRDGELDVDAVVHANGPLEVRLGVHQRHANTMRLDERLDATNGRHQHFLVRGVTELEHPREEQDAGAIDFEEARSDSMNERHDDDRR